MKKTFLVNLFYILCISVNSQIKINYSIELGITDWNHTIYQFSNNLNVVQMESMGIPCYAELNLRVGWKGLQLETKVFTFMDKLEGDGFSFTPRYTEYRINFKYTYKWIGIGWEHSCTHSIWNDYTTLNAALYRAGYDRLFIRLEF